MQTTAIQSDVFATAEAASASVGGLAGRMGGGGEVRVISVNVREVEGGFIAVASIQILDPEIEPGQEADENADGERPSKEIEKALNGGAEMGIYYPMYSDSIGRVSAIPEEADDALGEAQTDFTPLYVDDLLEQKAAKSESHDSANLSELEPGPLVERPSEAELELSDKLKADFYVAEEANADILDRERLAWEEKTLQEELARKTSETEPAPSREPLT